MPYVTFEMNCSKMFRNDIFMNTKNITTKINTNFFVNKI